MPELMMDKSGFLIDAEGNQVLIQDEPIKVSGVQTQDQIDRVIEERLARQKEKIKTLEAQANKTPDLEKMIEDLKKERDKMEADLAAAQQAAEAEVASQLSNTAKRAEIAERALADERVARIRDQVTNQILQKSGDRFINPAKDVVPDLLTVHKREPVADSAGRPIPGRFIDLFDIAYKNEKGEETHELMPVDKALDALAAREDYQHYVRAAATGGSGGGNYTAFTGNLRRSQMSAAEKAEFVSRHGLEAFQQLKD
ncbi:hypothetical protein LLG95_05405 [bacterium]|nr:hypothetical protein [bacterium]